MADNTNGAAGADQPQFTIQKIYVKDVSFEVPGAPAIFNEPGQPQLELNLNQKVTRAADGLFEVVLGITLTCKSGEKVVYLAEVEQAGLFGLAGFDERQLDFMLGTHCPNALFPYARQAVGELISQGGFPPFYLQPINFAALYGEGLRRRAEAAANASAPAEGGVA
jgi:preprotein translocase subunit SecB